MLNNAARLYIKLQSDTVTVPTARIKQLLLAAANGLGPEDIVEILDTDELPVAAHEPPTEISIGDE